MFLYYIFIHFPTDNFKVKFTLASTKEVFSHFTVLNLYS